MIWLIRRHEPREAEKMLPFFLPRILWRCRESNPGPLALTQSFYERSPLNVFSVLTLTRTCSQRTHLQLVSPDAPATLHQGKPSSDARLRVEGSLGLTDFYRLCSE